MPFKKHHQEAFFNSLRNFINFKCFVQFKSAIKNIKHRMGHFFPIILVDIFLRNRGIECMDLQI